MMVWEGRCSFCSRPGPEVYAAHPTSATPLFRFPDGTIVCPEFEGKEMKSLRRQEGMASEFTR